MSGHLWDSGPEFYELHFDDIGKGWIWWRLRVWPCASWIGQILPGDVGKRVYLRGGVLQVENDAQRAHRLGQGAPADSRHSRGPSGDKPDPGAPSTPQSQDPV